MKKVWPGHSLEGRSSIKRTAFQGERERSRTLLQGPAPPTAPLRRATEGPRSAACCLGKLTDIAISATADWPGEPCPSQEDHAEARSKGGLT